MVGDAQIGKTSLMVKYVEGSFDEDYIQTLGKYGDQIWANWLEGVNFMEKTVSVRNTEITFSIWDLGGIPFLVRGVINVTDYDRSTGIREYVTVGV